MTSSFAYFFLLWNVQDCQDIPQECQEMMSGLKDAFIHFRPERWKNEPVTAKLNEFKLTFETKKFN